ncbi:MAG: D-alanyl-lipoteichoic acid biosynthesis protein DltB [Clostridiales bacterium]|nr:D-alanyl-lipoteichoic acid biosynthesis protein DltB [Clostridiales bacterium]
MELFGNFTFFGIAALVAIPAVVLGIKEKSLKYYTFFASLFFIWLAMGAHTKALIYLTVFCLLEYAIVGGYLYLRKKYGRKESIYWCFLLLSITPLTISKISGFLDMHIFGFLGISYLTFKATQMVIEIYDGIIKQASAFEFASFLLFFPAITSGPIDRSRRYSQNLNSIMPKNEYLELLGEGLYKIVKGMVYKFVIASTFYQGMLWLGMAHTFKNALVYMYCYGFYLFFDFAGYSAMAIGISYLFGIRTPENFKAPFVSKDIKEFWNRWHITLSYWFRDFVFSRLVMRAIKKKWFKAKLTAASWCFIINMTIMGLWHGLDSYYILYGLYHGVLLALTEIYQKRSYFHKKHKKDRWYQFVSWFITFNLVMFGFFIFSGRFTTLLGF